MPEVDASRFSCTVTSRQGHISYRLVTMEVSARRGKYFTITPSHTHLVVVMSTFLYTLCPDIAMKAFNLERRCAY